MYESQRCESLDKFIQRARIELIREETLSTHPWNVTLAAKDYVRLYMKIYKFRSRGEIVGSHCSPVRYVTTR